MDVHIAMILDLLNYFASQLTQRTKYIILRFILDAGWAVDYNLLLEIDFYCSMSIKFIQK